MAFFCLPLYFFVEESKGANQMKIKLTIGFVFLALLSSCQVFKEGLISSEKVSETEIVNGLKEALRTGIDIMADSANLKNGYWDRSPENGYLKRAAIRILLPQEAEKAMDAAQEMSSTFNSWKSNLIENDPFGLLEAGLLLLDIDFLQDLSLMENLKDSIWQSLNKAAEHAAPKSKTVFYAAITDMSLQDGKNILFSNDSSAATHYLEDKTFNSLQEIFQPIVKTSMETFRANSLWKEYASLYNGYQASYAELQVDIQSISLIPDSYKDQIKLPINLPGELPTDLSAYTTEKALNGLFYLVGSEEKRIRQDPFQYGKDLLEKIFTLVKEELI
jgi:hypothetical protein